jgi:endo-1,4-beta-xylanase
MGPKGCFFIALALFALGGCDTAMIQGRVTSATDGAPLQAEVLLFQESDPPQPPLIVATDEDGRYSIRDRSTGNFTLVAIPRSEEIIDGYRLHGHMPQHVRFTLALDQKVIKDFHVIPSHDYILEAYRPDGTLINHQDWFLRGFAVDETGNATIESSIPITGKGQDALPCVHVPLGQRRTFYQRWTVPGFGYVVLPIDNSGRGFRADSTGGTVLNFNLELARTQIHRLKVNLQEYEGDGYSVPNDIRIQASRTGEHLDRAERASGAEMAALADEATRIALYALESLELARAEQDIERYRKGELALTILDDDGRPISDAPVEIRQISHDFLFGIAGSLHLAPPGGYELMREAGVNFATLMFYWDWTEHEQDMIVWDWIDHGIGVLDLHEMGFELKPHALQSLWPWGNPQYLIDLARDFPSLNTKTDEHISALVSRYRDQIDTWNVINEAHFRGGALDLNRDEITTLTKTGIEAIRKHDPGSRIIIECMFDWYGESRRLWPDDDFTVSILDYWKQLDEAKVDYDIIGQQLYNGGLIRFFADHREGQLVGMPTWDLEHLSSVLDESSRFGKPVHITEQSVPSTWDDDWFQYGAGWWHRPWDEEVQAEFLRAFYTIGFSKPKVEAISWWSISDTDLNLIHTGGLLTEDGRPKKAYFALKELIQGWTSSGEVRSDALGEAVFEGFAGDYELTITRDGETWQRTAHISEQKRQQLTIRLGKP